MFYPSKVVRDVLAEASQNLVHDDNSTKKSAPTKLTMCTEEVCMD